MTDAELIARLRVGVPTVWEKQAADRIEALVKERDEAKRLMQARHREMLAADGLMRKHQRRAERMEEALHSMLEAAKFMYYGTAFEKDFRDEIATLKGADQ